MVCYVCDIELWVRGSSYACTRKSIQSPMYCNLLYTFRSTQTPIYYYLLLLLCALLALLAVRVIYLLPYYHCGKIVHKLRAMNFLRFLKSGYDDCRICESY